METTDVTSKVGTKWFLANNGTQTIWFRKQEDRDYYVGGGNISTKPGRDEKNAYYEKRLGGTSAPVTRPQTTDSGSLASTSGNPVKVKLERIIKELQELVNLL